jgi:filamentous hemagglutinin
MPIVHDLLLHRLFDAANYRKESSIDGGSTFITSAALDNLGTGRLYGDHLAIRAGTLRNDVENGGAPVIAARERLDLAVDMLTNREHAQILSLGDLVIGNQLDADHHAVGAAQTVRNQSATIQAMGNLSIAAGEIVNEDLHFSMGTQTGSEYIEEFQGLTSTTEKVSAGPRYYWDPPNVDTFQDETWFLHTPEGNYDGWRWYKYQRTTETPYLISSDPSQIIAGGTLTLAGGATTNDKSQIIAGSALNLSGGSLQNIDVIAQQLVEELGTVTSYDRDQESGNDGTRIATTGYSTKTSHTVAVLPFDLVQAYASTGGVFVQNRDQSGLTQAAQGAGTGTVNVAGIAAPGAGATPGSAPGPNLNPLLNPTLAANPDPAAAPDTGPIRPALDLIVASLGDKGQDLSDLLDGTTPAPWLNVAGKGKGPQASLLTLPTLPSLAPAAPRFDAVVRSTTAPATVPNSSLYTLDKAGQHLVNIDPNFINGSYYLSSDYLLQLLGQNPALTQARLGDGYYEQELVRQQIIQLTGQRNLGGYASDEAQYQALLQNGATYATAWNLVPGVALSAEQVAQLTSDIVWLVEQTVTLPDGSTQQVLVPQVYAVVQQGDLDGSGALLSGKTVNVNLSGDLANSGTIGGQQLLALNAENVTNLNRISGGVVSVNARVDVNNLGGVIDAKDQLAVTAGNDINLLSTTTSNATAQGSNTLLDRIAGLYVTRPDGGDLLLAAGNNLNLAAAQISNAYLSIGRTMLQ